MKRYGSKIRKSLFLIFCLCLKINGLQPVESPTREIKKLDGVWNFRICFQDDQDQGFREKWFNKPLYETGEVIPMPVPSSFNDITQNKTIRDYLGWVWYDTHFYIPERWMNDKTTILRFGSAHYHANVYINGNFVVNHTGGHLPFEADVSVYLKHGSTNRLTVALNNTLSSSTIPQGSKTFKSSKDGPYPPGYYQQGTNFDFFNYAGIHRSVVLYAVPQYHLQDVTIITQISNGNAKVFYSLQTNGDKSNVQQQCQISVMNKEGKKVAVETSVSGSTDCSGSITLENATLWWPYTMHPNPGYQYTMQISTTFITSSGTIVSDVYFQKFGVRSIAVEGNQFLVNGKPFYFMGFGKHEDANIRGKGLDIPLIIKDFNLIKWIGANSFRTSHYPYAEELMDQADEQGIAVIDECPAVGLTAFNKELLTQHLQILTELVSRDKNRPSVFAWSTANEPQSSKKGADHYFKEIVLHVKQLDPTRPVTAALNQDYKTDRAGQHMDFIMYNHYYAWYADTGSTETILPLLVNQITLAHNAYKKPIMMSEYGADTIAGLHTDPVFIFTEDYQVELMIEHHKAFDILKGKGFFFGEHIWNFADFMTLQQINRVVGNKKGIFTRERQPKASARLLRCRYHSLSQQTLDGDLAYCPARNTIHQSCQS